MVKKILNLVLYSNDNIYDKMYNALSNFYKISSGKEGPSHKADETTLRASFEKTLPNYDKDRVYFSDIKKFFQWYNMLLAEGLLIMEVEVSEVVEKGKTEKAETLTPKKASAKKTNVPKSGTPPAKSMKAGAGFMHCTHRLSVVWRVGLSLTKLHNCVQSLFRRWLALWVRHRMPPIA